MSIKLSLLVSRLIPNIEYIRKCLVSQLGLFSFSYCDFVEQLGLEVARGIDYSGLVNA